MAELEKTWLSLANHELADTGTVLGVLRSMLWQLKALLTGQVGELTAQQGAWTVVGSSDGTAAGMDNTDRWGDTYDAAKLVQSVGVTIVAHSWIVLRSPAAAGPYYMTIDLAVGTTNSAQRAMFTFSKAAPTGGSITARPTATDEWTHNERDLIDGNVGARRGHLTIAPDGTFHYLMSRNGFGRAYTVIALWELAEVREDETYKHVSLVVYDQSYGPLHEDSSSPWNYPTNRCLLTRGAAGVLHCCPIRYYAYTTQLNASISTVDNGDGRHWDMPLYIYGEVSGGTWKTIKGRLIDVKWGPNGLGSGSVSPLAPEPINVQAHNATWLPASAPHMF